MHSNHRLKIAIDAMGGDHAPTNEIAGCLLALREVPGEFEAILVGPENVLREHLRQHTTQNLPLSIVDAREVITMEDSPTAALKQKRDSSLAVGMRLHQEGKADAFVSAGNTGAVLSAATLILGRVRGVSRPTIGTFIPSEQGVCLLLDAGTNVDCRAQHLLEFAVMGSIYFQKVFRKERPSVGLLNVGEEKTKGTEVVLEAHRMLSASSLNFIGNVEGRDILRSKADVVVCDGFVGNIVLKFGESVPHFLKARLQRDAGRSLLTRLKIGFARGALRKALGDMDPNEHGGVPVLGVNGVAIIGHGSSSVKGIKNMVLKAVEVAGIELNRYIEEALAGMSAGARTGGAVIASATN